MCFAPLIVCLSVDYPSTGPVGCFIPCAHKLGKWHTHPNINPSGFFCFTLVTGNFLFHHDSVVIIGKPLCFAPRDVKTARCRTSDVKTARYRTSDVLTMTLW